MCAAHSPRASGAAGNLPLRELRILPEAFLQWKFEEFPNCKKISGTTH